MNPKKGNIDPDEDIHEIKARLHSEPEIKRLKSKFDLSEDAANAAVMIYRLLVGLGKGLSSSKRRSFSAVALWHGAQVADDEKLLKEDLARAVELSPRTLTRRFREIEKDENCVNIIDHVKDKVKKWSERRDRSLRRLM